MYYMVGCSRCWDPARYCPESSARQVIAWMQLASEHHQQQLESLEVAMKNAMDLPGSKSRALRHILERSHIYDIY